MSVRFAQLLHAVVHVACAGLLVSAAAPAWAQFRERTTPSPRIPAARSLSTELQLAGAPTTSDYIVAVVNQEPITHTDVDKRVSRIQEWARAGSKLPPEEEILRAQVLDALIDEKVQISYAKTVGLDIPDAEVDAAIEGIAAQNQLTLPDLKQRMKADGLDFDRYRASLREQILLQRLREREVMPRIVITDQELDEFVKDNKAGQSEVALNVAHILIPVPEGATPGADPVPAGQGAGHPRPRRQGAGNFAQLAKDNSADTGTRDQGGALGLRPASRLPELFVAATGKLKVGEIAPLVRSNAGFHIIKLVQRENTAAASYTQQRARHILLRTSPQASTEDMSRRMKDIRKQIVGGQASFAQMARQYSEDGSGAKGGDLGWASPGQFVPEFEKALNALQPGEISEPVVSRFGVHLISSSSARKCSSPTSKSARPPNPCCASASSSPPTSIGVRSCGPRPGWRCAMRRDDGHKPRDGGGSGARCRVAAASRASVSASTS
ncbi:MAG: peptidylprolyl isomerase [Aquabacterium sp.]